MGGQIHSQFEQSDSGHGTAFPAADGNRQTQITDPDAVNGHGDSGRRVLNIFHSDKTSTFAWELIYFFRKRKEKSCVDSTRAACLCSKKARAGNAWELKISAMPSDSHRP
jgi:hypothetical protein